MVETICCTLNKVRLQGISFHEQITFVADRPGHDMRYAIDVSNIQKEFGWKPLETFESGMWKIRHGVKMFRMLLN